MEPQHRDAHHRRRLREDDAAHRRAGAADLLQLDRRQDERGQLRGGCGDASPEEREQGHPRDAAPDDHQRALPLGRGQLRPVQRGQAADERPGARHLGVQRRQPARGRLVRVHPHQQEQVHRREQLPGSGHQRRLLHEDLRGRQRREQVRCQRPHQRGPRLHRRYAADRRLLPLQERRQPPREAAGRHLRDGHLLVQPRRQHRDAVDLRLRDGGAAHPGDLHQEHRRPGDLHHLRGRHHRRCGDRERERRGNRPQAPGGHGDARFRHHRQARAQRRRRHRLHEPRRLLRGRGDALARSHPGGSGEAQDRRRQRGAAPGCQRQLRLQGREQHPPRVRHHVRRAVRDLSRRRPGYRQARHEHLARGPHLRRRAYPRHAFHRHGRGDQQQLQPPYVLDDVLLPAVELLRQHRPLLHQDALHRPVRRRLRGHGVQGRRLTSRRRGFVHDTGVRDRRLHQLVHQRHAGLGQLRHRDRGQQGRQHRLRLHPAQRQPRPLR